MMRLSLLMLALSASSACAQTAPAAQQSSALPFYAPKTSFTPTAFQLAEYTAHVKKCLGSHKRIRNWVRLTVTIGPGGKIVGEPEVVSPVDSDEFREDVKNVVEKIHQCEPYVFVGSDMKDTLKQPFNFEPNLDDDVKTAIQQHFRECWAPVRPKTGPDVVVELTYKPDGSYAEPPHAVSSANTAGYAKAAAVVVDLLGKCPPLQFPKEKFGQVQRITWTFATVESLAAYERRNAATGRKAR